MNIKMPLKGFSKTETKQFFSSNYNPPVPIKQNFTFIAFGSYTKLTM